MHTEEEEKEPTGALSRPAGGEIAPKQQRAKEHSLKHRVREQQRVEYEEEKFNDKVSGLLLSLL